MMTAPSDFEGAGRAAAFPLPPPLFPALPPLPAPHRWYRMADPPSGRTGPERPACRARRDGQEDAGGGELPRILVVDDNAGILENFRRILAEPGDASDGMAAMEAVLFADEGRAESAVPAFDVETVSEGRMACERADAARRAGRPFSIAFVDMRMPGGWDGLRTIEELWRIDPGIEVVICTAYSDFGWSEIAARLGRSDQLLILRKPFEMIEVQQLAAALSQKWSLRREARQRMESLELQVAERTRHLDEALRVLAASNVRLTETLDTAAAASEAKTKFFTGLSHELRTPLNAVIGFAELMEHEAFGPLGAPRYHEYAATIAESGRHLLALINDILDLSRLDAGHLPLQEEVLDLAEVAGECVRMMQPQAEQAQVDLQLDVATGLPALRADHQRLRQILLNLLSNATKFTPEGGQVRLSACRKDGAIVLEVADTGIGMAAEEIPRAVEQFGQIDSPLNRRHSGSGLGLPLTKGLVELHGGSFAIASAPGKGTTVTIAFPPARVIEGSAGVH